MVIVSRRVVERRERIVHHAGDSISREFRPEFLQILRVRREKQLLLRGKTIQTDILQLPVLGVERIPRALRARHTAPYGRIHLRQITIHRHTVLEELFLILQDILGNLTQVKIKVATLGGLVINERIQQPELDVLIIGGLQIAGFDLPGNTAPTPLRIAQRPVRVDVIRVQIVRATFVGIKSQV